jgi:MFS superfamily sulfate permease-like transporter
MISSLREYIAETWDDPSLASRARTIACIAVFCLHVPLSLSSAIGYGLAIVIGLAINGFTLLCVALALWKLAAMIGRKEVFGRT